jgi:hypothetical protein
MSQQEIKFFLNKTLSGMKETNQENRELRDRLVQLESKVNAPPPEEPDPDDEKPLNELIIENPEKAIERVARERGWIRTMESIGTKTDEALFDTVSARIEGFEEFEDDVRGILRETGAPVTKETISRAYEMAVCRRSLEDRSRKRRELQNAEKTPPDPPKDEKKLPEESELEREIREAHGKTREDWERYKNDDFTIKLPTG